MPRVGSLHPSFPCIFFKIFYHSLVLLRMQAYSYMVANQKDLLEIKKKKDLLFSLCSSGLSELSLLTWNHFQVMQDLYTYLDLNEEGYQFKPQMAVCPVFPTVSPSGRGGLLQKWWLVSR